MFTDKTTQSVADAVKKIMEADAQKKVEEALIGAQKNIDKNHNNKIDAQDFKILKGQKKEVEVNEMDKSQKSQERGGDYPLGLKNKDVNMVKPITSNKVKKDTSEILKKAFNKEEVVKEDNKDTPPFDGPYKSSFKKPNNPNRTGMDAARSLAQRAMDKVAKKDTPVKEESEQIEEVKLADLTPRKIEGKSYGKSYVDPEGSEDADDMKSKKKVSKGTYSSRATRGFETPAAKAKKDAKIAMRRESFTELLNSYQEDGIKGLFEKLEYVEEEILDEEPSNDEFTAELQDAKAKAEGKGKKAEVAKPKVMATSNEEVEQIEERTLTDDETDKKEEIVKSMKKGLAGFKERYGKDAKSVMYATATKQAKRD